LFVHIKGVAQTRTLQRALELKFKDIKKKGKCWQEIENTKLWEERKDWRHSIHQSIQNRNVEEVRKGKWREEEVLYSEMSKI
jgi:hypothetical protein